MLSIKNVSKTYASDIQALKDVNLTIGKGIFGLLGPNGAGKSTLMRTLASLQLPSTGSVILNNLDILENSLQARKIIGYLPQDLGVYPRVSAHEMLSYLAGLKGITSLSRQKQVEDLLERVNLADVAHQQLDTYSGGMRRRFGIATAFIGSPELVIVDEPTAGLDPAERRRFQLLLAEAAKECILILSSHIVEDIAGLCTDMAVMDKGQILSTGAPQAQIDSLQGQVWQRDIEFEELQKLKDEYKVLSWRPHQGKLVIRLLSDSQPKEGFQQSEADLEDLYAAHISYA
ncbi:MAG: ATP-binding cassette domain-containing protein [Pseudomonadota bacterium]